MRVNDFVKIAAIFAREKIVSAAEKRIFVAIMSISVALIFCDEKATRAPD